MFEKHFLRSLMGISLRMTSNFANKPLVNIKRMSTSADPDVHNLKTLAVTVPKPFVYHVQLNRPDQLNAMNDRMWTEIGVCFNALNSNEDCRVIVLSAAGKLFTAGLDFKGMMSIGEKLSQHEDVARRCKILTEMIVKYQNSLTSLEKCLKPVICLIHNACIGGGVDLITAADIRYCTEDAIFQVKEVDIGMAADVGTLQRLPRVIGSTSLVNELCFTARKMKADEAKECGLVNRIFKDKESMVACATDIASEIASKSPVAVQGTKRSIVYSRDHTVQEGLDDIANWNQTMLQSEDFMNASVAQATKSPPPPFAKL